MSLCRFSTNVAWAGLRRCTGTPPQTALSPPLRAYPPETQTNDIVQLSLFNWFPYTALDSCGVVLPTNVDDPTTLRPVLRTEVAGTDAVGHLQVALLEDLLNNVDVLLSAKLVLELLIRGAAEEALRALVREEDLECCERAQGT